MNLAKLGTLIGMVALTGALAAAAPAAAESVRLTVIGGVPANHPAVRIFRKQFQGEVERRLAAANSDIEITWASAYGGTLARSAGVLEAVEDGLADFGIIEVEAERDRLPLQDITFHLPFTSTDCAAVAAAYHALHREMPAMNAPWQNTGQFYLANMTTDGYELIAFQRIKAVADVRGLTVAMTGRNEGWLDGLAATVVRLPANQLAAALDARRVEAAIVPVTEMALLELDRLDVRVLETGLGAQTAFAISMSEARFEAMPPVLQRAVRQAAEAFVPMAANAYCQAGEDALARLEQRGMSSQRLFRTRREEWVSLLPPLGRIWSRAREAEGHPGDAILSAFMNQVRKAGVTPMRAWDQDPPPTN